MIYDKFKAKKRSSEVEAIQLHMVSSRSYRKCAEFSGKLWKGITEDSELPSVLTPLGYVKVNNHDYIIKDPKGVFYVCPQHVFEQTYEILDDVDESDESKPNLEYINGELLYQAGTVPDEERLKLISLIISEMDNSDKTDDISDGYHTFEELYYQRMLLTKTVALAAISNFDKDTVYRSKLHLDGTMYKDFFIVVFNTPEGNFSYHYHMAYWGVFDFLKERPNAGEFDGHTWKDVTRLQSLFTDRSAN